MNDLDIISAAILAGDWAIPPFGSIVRLYRPNNCSIQNYRVTYVEIGHQTIHGGWAACFPIFDWQEALSFQMFVHNFRGIVSLPDDARPFCEWPRLDYAIWCGWVAAPIPDWLRP